MNEPDVFAVRSGAAPGDPCACDETGVCLWVLSTNGDRTSAALNVAAVSRHDSGADDLSSKADSKPWEVCSISWLTGSICCENFAPEFTRKLCGNMAVPPSSEYEAVVTCLPDSPTAGYSAAIVPSSHGTEAVWGELWLLGCELLDDALKGGSQKLCLPPSLLVTGGKGLKALATPGLSPEWLPGIETGRSVFISDRGPLGCLPPGSAASGLGKLPESWLGMGRSLLRGNTLSDKEGTPLGTGEGARFALLGLNDFVTGGSMPPWPPASSHE